MDEFPSSGSRMHPEPLSPADVDALLARDDPRTAAADLLVLRDALLELAGAWEALAAAAAALTRDRELPRPPSAPRGD
jgi:hypothetical protein